MGKDDVVRIVNRVVASAMQDRFGMVRMIGNRSLPLGAGSYGSQDLYSVIIIQRSFTGPVWSNSTARSGGRTVSRCLETQCNPESGKMALLCRMPDQSSRSFGDRCIGSMVHVGSTLGSGLTATGRRCTLTANKPNWVTALQRNVEFSSSNSGQDGTKIGKEKISIGDQSGEDAMFDKLPQDGPTPDPPGLFATMGAMTAGAGGAVLVAALGVWAVFKMAFWVAKETGHSLLSSTNAPNKMDPLEEQVHPDR